MASHSQYIPHIESTPDTSKSPQKKEQEHMYPEISYALPHEELNKFRRITRAYAQQIGGLPLAPLLPYRKQLSRPFVDTPDQVFFHTVEDMIVFSLTEIKQPINMITETPVGNYSEPNDFESDQEGSSSDRSASESEYMKDNNDNNEERGDQPRDNQPWMARDSLAIPGWVHNLPRHPEKLLPKFDLKTSGLLEDHIKKFILAIILMNV